MSRSHHILGVVIALVIASPLFASDTPTPTLTPTATRTPTATPTPTFASPEVSTGSPETLSATLELGECRSGMMFATSAREYFVVVNDSESAVTVDIDSVTHPSTGLTADISEEVAAGETRIFGAFRRSQYAQRSGPTRGKVVVALSAEDAALLCGLYRPPIQ